MSIFRFTKREPDWWFYTLLPIFLFLVTSIFFNPSVKNFKIFIYIFGQQLLFYSIILSSTDLGLKARDIKRKYQISYSLLLVFLSTFALIYTYINENMLREREAPLIIFSIIFTMIFYFSILFYNKNPLSTPVGPGPEQFRNLKKEQEQKAEKDFTSKPKRTVYKGAKWGENNE